MKNFLFIMLLFTGIVDAQFVNIPDANFKAKLIALGVDTNFDGQIQQAEVSTMSNLEVDNSDIADLTGIGAFTNLVSLSCFGNQLTTLDISGLANLALLNCNNNNLTTLDLSTSTALLELRCDNNQLTSLDFTNCVALFQLECRNNQLTVLDFSNCPDADTLSMNNNLLTQVFLKNGTYQVADLSDNENLQFVCIDDGFNEDDLVGIGANVVVGYYCSFVPGGDYNTISGTVRYDADNNGCDALDSSLPFIRVDLLSGVNSGSSFLNNNGSYAFYTSSGNFTIAPHIENQAFFNITPLNSVVNFPTVDNSVSINNFCITANGSHSDVEVVIAPLGDARPGFDAMYKIVYKNKGNQTMSGNIIFGFDDAAFDFISAIPSPNAQAMNSLSFDYFNLLPFENRQAILTLHVHSAGDVPPVNIGDQLAFTANISPSANDETVADNYFGLHQIAVAAYDPNSKTCLEGNTVTPAEIGNYLHYAINFENTGNADALNIVVKDTIDIAKFDISSLQVLNASHPVNIKITGNIVEFIFENINLPPSAINPIGGHGNVLFKIKTLPTLHAGDMVSNTANIYFDYNAPIDTNEARTIFTALANKEFAKDESISVYPNPAKDKVKISAKTPIKSVEIYDVAGRILERLAPIGKSAEADLSAKAKGVYFFRIQSENGGEIKKIIKK